MWRSVPNLGRKAFDKRKFIEKNIFTMKGEVIYGEQNKGACSCQAEVEQK